MLDKDRKLAYKGAIDDNIHADKVEKRHIRRAIDALLDGKTPETPVTQQFGCGIHYE